MKSVGLPPSAARSGPSPGDPWREAFVLRRGGGGGSGGGGGDGGGGGRPNKQEAVGTGGEV